jgi:spore coat protein U-like protein
VTYGKEQAERVSVTVSAPGGATPSGTVTVNAGTIVICGSAELVAGQASCTVAAAKLPAGTWHLTATYSGSTSLAPSASTPRTLTVAKAASKITLSLSAARVTYGQERSERLTVKVTGQYAGTPAGKVTVKSGKTTVCTITLASGKGSCTLAAKKLPAGTRTLIAVYGGNGDFTAATSARKALKVVK